MHITRWGELGTLCVCYIAQRERDGARPVGATELAESQDIQPQYAQQILQRLRKGGIIDSVRGPHGGYYLARSADEITLRDIILAVEGETFEVMCESKPVYSDCRSERSGCGLKGVWYELYDLVDSFLSGKTVAQLLDEFEASQPEKQLVSLPTQQ